MLQSPQQTFTIYCRQIIADVMPNWKTLIALAVLTAVLAVLVLAALNLQEP